MLTPTQATEIAEQELRARSRNGIELGLIAHATEEFESGWVFYYQSTRYIEKGVIEDCVVGNAPFFVARADGQLFTISYHRPTAESVAAYCACGNPNAREMPEVLHEGSPRSGQ